MGKNSQKQPKRERLREPTSGGFKKGDPRINYKGRPPDLVGFRQLMREVGEEQALKVLLEGMEHYDPQVRVKCAEHWLAYCRGKPSQQVQVTGAEGGPLQISDGHDLSRLSLEELKAWRELRRKAAVNAQPLAS